MSPAYTRPPCSSPPRSADSSGTWGNYNVYSRQNQYFVFVDLNIKTNQPVAKQVSLLPVIPGFSCNFRF